MRLRSNIARRGRLLAWAIARRVAAGGAVVCPICQLRLRWFLPFGVGGRLRSHALCPGCRSLERDRFAWLRLNASSEVLAPALRLLHIAPEPCLEPRLRKLLGTTYVTGDLLRSDVDHRLSVEQLPFADRTFDGIICNHVLEHVHDDRLALREIFRTLRPGGWALLQVPLSDESARTLEDPTVSSASERKRRFGQHDHVRSYGRDYHTRLTDAGFALQLSRVKELYGSEEITRYGLDPGETLHFCRRPQAQL